MKTVGIILLLLGFLASVLTGFHIITKRLAGLSPEEINSPDTVSLYWSPITAIALLTSGAIILFMAKKEKRFTHR